MKTLVNIKNWNMKKRIIITIITSLIFVILFTNIVSASFWACFAQGEKIDFCNPKTPDRTCSSKFGCNSYCMNTYNETRECYNQANPNACNGIPKDCSSMGSNHTIDGKAPEFVLNNPVQDGEYTSRSILIDFDLDEKSAIYYYDNLNNRARWSRLCTRCAAGNPSYSRSRSFREGLNNITFSAVDVIGNEINFTRVFTIDSKDPRIHRTEPRRGYASGSFEVQYTETNLKSITLFYGNEEIGIRNQTLENCESGTKKFCDINVGLEDYNGEKIMYYFVIEDGVGNIKKSQMRRNLPVDTIFPVLNNPDSFWTQGEGRYARYVSFEFNITEENLAGATYSYLDSRDRVRTRRLCSRLRNGMCNARTSFSRGTYNLDIQIVDKAGNAVGYSTGEFDVDY